MRSVIQTFNIFVAPFAGAWIEIYVDSVKSAGDFVAPFDGAWIAFTNEVPGAN